MANAHVFTTQAAADLLGISVSSVQHLVEDGALEAWKTRGGHRRIPLAAITAYMALHDPMAARAPAAAPAPAEPYILVVEDNPLQRALYQHRLDSWALDATIAYCDNGYQALLAIARARPRVVLTDIVMDGIDGFEIVRTIVADPLLASTSVAVLTTLTQAELDQRGGLPPGVLYFPKPINFDELRGYLRACCAGNRRAPA
jgi:excisionase family DNA binding protein